MERIIVTGATSMIGVALIKECIRQGIKVLALVRSTSNRMARLPQSDLIQTLHASLEDLEQLLLPELKYDCFYHFAWENTSKEGRDNPELQLKNINYTMNAVKLAHKYGCKKFIGAGSQAEYGICESVITEHTKCSPEISYGICKYAAGKLAGKLCHQLNMICIWGRVFSVYGENDNEGTMIHYAFEQFYKKETAKFSSGTQMWNYLYESDAGKIFYLLGEKCNQNKTYLIAHNVSKPLKEYILDIKQVLGETFQYDLVQDINKKKVVLNVDTKELNKDIAYYPQIDFISGIKKLKKCKFAKKEKFI